MLFIKVFFDTIRAQVKEPDEQERKRQQNQKIDKPAMKRSYVFCKAVNRRTNEIHKVYPRQHVAQGAVYPHGKHSEKREKGNVLNIPLGRPAYQPFSQNINGEKDEKGVENEVLLYLYHVEFHPYRRYKKSKDSADKHSGRHKAEQIFFHSRRFYKKFQPEQEKNLYRAKVKG